MSEPSSHYTQVNGLRLHYLEAGEGDPILLLHGFPTSSHLYRNVIPTLAETHRVIAPDLPGYGLSDKPLDVDYSFELYESVLNNLLDALGIAQTNLVVHDLGGPIGLYWATHNPQRVANIVLLNTLVYPETSWAVKLALLALRTPVLRDYIVSPKGIIGAMKLGVVHKERLSREVLTPYTAPFETPAARKALIKAGSGLSIQGLAEIARKLPNLEVSLRLIYGETDRALPDVAKTMQRIQRAHPQAELTALPNCGHFLQEDEPERVAELIGEFLNTFSPLTNAAPTPNPPANQPPHAPKPTAIPIDLTPARDPAVEVIHAFNAWAANDLAVPPAAVTHCALKSLPDNPRDLMHLLPDAHKTFFTKAAGPTYETLQFTPAQTTNSFDPTADMLPAPSETPEGQHAQATATSYFHTHPVEVVQATGTDTAADLLITFQIALDPQASLIFTFITDLSD
jgi:haloalkane dehalogenase